MDPPLVLQAHGTAVTAAGPGPPPAAVGPAGDVQPAAGVRAGGRGAVRGGSGRLPLSLHVDLGRAAPLPPQGRAARGVRLHCRRAEKVLPGWSKLLLKGSEAHVPSCTHGHPLGGDGNASWGARM